MRAALVVLALGLSGCAVRAWFRPAPVADGSREVPDVPYWEGDDFDTKKHRLDVYVPPGEGPHPVVVFVHGGGWILGDRQQPGGNYRLLGRRLSSQGVLAMVISYRLAPWSTHPAQIRDTARALSWALAHAPDYGGDATSVFAMGHSAGAQLVALAACDPRWLGEQGASPSQLAGVVGVSGPYDVEHLGRALFIGGPLVIPTFGRDKAVWRRVSPATHLKAFRPPPFFVAWADGDAEILRHDSLRFAEALATAGVAVETYQTTFEDHLSIITEFGDVGNALGQKVLGFVRQQRAERRRLAGGEASPPP